MHTLISSPTRPAFRRMGVPLAFVFCGLTILVGGCFSREERAQEGDRSSGAEPSGRLLLTGSSTMELLVREMGKRFREMHPCVRIEVRTGGSGRGVSEVRSGVADIGMVSRALNDNERDLIGFPIARDGICLLVHRDNPVKSLRDGQIADIFQGKATNWNMVGGPDLPITVIDRSPGRAEVEVFAAFFGLKGEGNRDRIFAGENLEGFRLVAEDRQAITYISLGEAVRRRRAGMSIKLLPVQGVRASKEQVRTGNYPFARPLTLVTKALPTGVAKQFVDFAMSSQVTDMVEECDFVPYLD